MVYFSYTEKSHIVRIVQECTMSIAMSICLYILFIFIFSDLYPTMSPTGPTPWAWQLTNPLGKKFHGFSQAWLLIAAFIKATGAIGIDPVPTALFLMFSVLGLW